MTTTIYAKILLAFFSYILCSCALCSLTEVLIRKAYTRHCWQEIWPNGRSNMAQCLTSWNYFLVFWRECNNVPKTVKDFKKRYSICKIAFSSVANAKVLGITNEISGKAILLIATSLRDIANEILCRAISK